MQAPNAITQHPELEARAQRDLFERARAGAFIYTAVWLVIASWAGLWTAQTAFALSNLVALITITTLRVANLRVASRSSDGLTGPFHWLTVLVLVGALHWGALSAWVIFGADFESLRYTFMIMLPAFAMGGTTVLGISRCLRFAYPALIFGPTLVSGVVVGGPENLMLVTLALCAVVYVLIASRSSAADYWSATYNSKVATERAQLLEIQSITDPLTGVHNRLHFNKSYGDALAACARSELAVSIAMVDLDHFKQINDSYGHLAGDSCLKTVAAALMSGIRKDRDTLARFGGEEFVVLMPGTNLEEARAIAERMVELVADLRVEHDGIAISLTCSVGLISAIPSEAESPAALLASADQALYAAKANGRNQVTTFTAADGLAERG